MANALRGQAAVTADGTTWTMVLDVNAFCEIEGETGLGAQQLGEKLQDSPSFTLLRTVFWAALQDQHPGTDARAAGRLMSSIGVEGMNDTLIKLVSSAMPPADAAAASAEGKAPAPRKKAGAG